MFGEVCQVPVVTEVASDACGALVLLSALLGMAPLSAAHCPCYGKEVVVALGWPNTAFPLPTQPHLAFAGAECSPDTG